MSTHPRRAAVLLLLLTVSLGPLPAAQASPHDFPDHPDLSNLHASASMGHAYDIVFIGDGYTKEQREAFFADAEAISSGLLNFGPYADSQWLINAHALFVPSAQSGADHPKAEEAVDTAFDATYDSFGIAHLITAQTAKVLNAVAGVMPAYDLAVLIVNDPAYGGSGGEVAIVSIAPESLAILRHEVAHSIGNLADEYDSANPNAKFEDPEPNVASLAHLSPLKWAHWVDKGTPIPTAIADSTGPYSPIGAYEGARYFSKDMFRPSPDCLMRTLDKVFCPVCREVMLLRFAADSKMLWTHAPPTAAVDCTLPDCPTFTVEVADLDDLEIRWLLAGAQVGTGPSWKPDSTAAGQGQLVAEVRHATPHVRHDPQSVMLETAQWQVQIRGPIGTADAGALDGAQSAADGGTVEAPDAEALPGCSAGVGRVGAGTLPVGLLMLLLLGFLRRRSNTKERS